MRKVCGWVKHFAGSKLGSRLILAISIGLFLSLTISRLQSAAFWFDESFSAYMTRFNFGEITSLTAADVHPPVYYYLLKGWTMLFGNSIIAIRAMSVLFAVIAIGLTFVLIKQLFNRRTAALTALLLAISPIMVRYGIEARMYMVVLTITLAATLMLIRAMRTNKTRDYLIYGTLVSLGMWTHYFTAVVWIGHWVCRLVATWLAGYRGKKLANKYFAKQWLMAFGWAILLYLPWLPILIKQFSSVSGGFWIPPITTNTPIEYLANILVYREGDQPSGWLAILLFATMGLLTAAGIKYCRQLKDVRSKQNLALIVTMAFVPVVCLMVLSLPPLSSVFIDRYLITSIVFTVGLFAVIGLGVKYKSKLNPALLGLVGVGACSLIGITRVNYYNNQTLYNALVGDVVAEIQQTDQSDTPIIITDPYAYYVAAARDDSRLYLVSQSINDDQAGSLAMLRSDRVVKTGEDINQFLAEHKTAWVVGITGNDTVPAPDGATNWQSQKTVSVYNYVANNHDYKATLYSK